MWNVKAEAHRDLRLHLWSDLNSWLGEQQLAPGLCMPQFSFVFVSFSVSPRYLALLCNLSQKMQKKRSFR